MTEIKTKKITLIESVIDVEIRNKGGKEISISVTIMTSAVIMMVSESVKMKISVVAVESTVFEILKNDWNSILIRQVITHRMKMMITGIIFI